MPERSESYSDDALVAVGAGAALIGVSPQTLRKYANDGLIEVHRTPSNQRRFRVRDLRSLITTEPTTASDEERAAS